MFAHTLADEQIYIVFVLYSLAYYSTLAYLNLKSFSSSFCEVALDCGNSMLSHYHWGAYGLEEKDKWSCCKSTDRMCQGCHPVGTGMYHVPFCLCGELHGRQLINDHWANKWCFFIVATPLHFFMLHRKLQSRQISRLSACQIIVVLPTHTKAVWCLDNPYPTRIVFLCPN